MDDKQDEAVRKQIKDWVDGMPSKELHAIKRFVQYVMHMEDPFLRKLAEAPWDDEPVTEDDLLAIAEAESDIAAGRIVSAKELEKELRI